MLNFFKLFQEPSPLDVAVKQLRMSQLQLLEACAAREAANGHVSVLEARVKRLQATVNAYAETAQSGE